MRDYHCVSSEGVIGNLEWGMGNGKWGMGKGKWEMGNEEWGVGNWPLAKKANRQWLTTKHKKRSKISPAPVWTKISDYSSMTELLFGHHPDMLSLPVVLHDHNGIRSCGQA